MKAKRITAVSGALLLIAAAAAVAITIAATPATAATNDFRGFNWADQRDNFVDDTLVLGGLSTADSYATTVAKATSLLNSATANLNTNTVRIPVNYATVSGSYWNSYQGCASTTPTACSVWAAVAPISSATGSGLRAPP